MHNFLLLKGHNLLILLASIIFSTASLFGQNSASEKEFYHQFTENLRNKYLNNIGDQLVLLNGVDYPGYRFPFENNASQFFGSTKPLTGSVQYKGSLFTNIRLFYDQINDQLILQDGLRQIQLFKDDVENFTILGHYFENISMADSLQEKEFYELIFNGNTQLYKKEKKIIVEQVDLSVKRIIKTNIEYYIKKEGSYFQIFTKKDIIMPLKDQKADIQQYIRKNKHNFKSNFENSLVEACRLYDKLSTKE